MPSIAVGPETFIVMTNPRTLLYSKAGALLAEEANPDVFRGLIPGGLGITDPRALFDAGSRRFYLVGAAGTRCSPPNCKAVWVLAVSKTAEPRTLGPSDWHLYAFDGSAENGRPTGQWGDFNVVGLTNEMLVLVGISIPANFQAYAKIWVFERAPLLAGAPVAGPVQEFMRLQDPASGRMLEKTYPAVAFGAGKTVFLASYSTRNCDIAVLGVTGGAGSAELKIHTVRAPGECRGLSHAPQFGGGVPLDTMPRFEAPPVYRDGHLWLVDSIARSVGGQEVGALRLVELDVSDWPGPPRFVRDDTFAENGIWYFNPALTVDSKHNVAIVTNRSSPAEYGSAWLTGRLASDPPGTFRPPVAIKHGEANWNWSETSHEPPIRTRNLFSFWSGAAIDPTDGAAWVVGQATRTACEWDLWIARTDFSLATGSSGVAPSPPAPVVKQIPCT